LKNAKEINPKLNSVIFVGLKNLSITLKALLLFHFFLGKVTKNIKKYGK